AIALDIRGEEVADRGVGGRIDVGRDALGIGLQPNPFHLTLFSPSKVQAPQQLREGDLVRAQGDFAFLAAGRGRALREHAERRIENDPAEVRRTARTAWPKRPRGVATRAG